jgi:hypothetical protein
LDKERDALKQWDAQESSFHRQQLFQRAAVRFKQGRDTLTDIWIALYASRNMAKFEFDDGRLLASSAPEKVVVDPLVALGEEVEVRRVQEDLDFLLQMMEDKDQMDKGRLWFQLLFHLVGDEVRRPAHVNISCVCIVLAIPSTFIYGHCIRFNCIVVE